MKRFLIAAMLLCILTACGAPNNSNRITSSDSVVVINDKNGRYKIYTQVKKHIPPPVLKTATQPTQTYYAKPAAKTASTKASKLNHNLALAIPYAGLVTLVL